MKKKLVTFTRSSNDMFHDMLKAEFVTLVSLKVKHFILQHIHT